MVQVKLIESTWLNRFLYKIFMPIGYKVAGLRFEERKPVGLLWRLLHSLGEFAIFHPLRDKLGLVNVKSAYSSGAALNPDVIRFFRAIGVNIKQLYGSTEAQVHTLHIGDDVRFETVGVAPPGMEIKIADDGEILVKGPTVVRGYYKNPEATEQAFVVDEAGQRWYRTGDAGYIGLDRPPDLPRPGQGNAHPVQRREVLAAVHRGAAQVQSLHPQRDDGRRRGQPLRDGADQHRL